MDENEENKLNKLQSEINLEFKKMNNYNRAKFAIEQMSLWRNKLNDTQKDIPDNMYGRVL